MGGVCSEGVWGGFLYVFYINTTPPHPPTKHLLLWATA